jgi:hypothetical protein
MLSDIKHGGMLEAQTGWQGFVPLIDSSEDGSGSIEWSLSGQTSSGSFMLDFTGDGTGDALTGMIKVSDDDRVGSWSASKVTTQFVSLEDLAGDWTEDFQWMGRGPGVLLRTCDAKGTCKIAAGQNGGPTSEEVGTVSLTGNRFDTTWPTERTQVGVFVSKDLAWGYMDTLDGKTPGTWTLSRGNQIDDSTSTPGCTSNSDCVGCERCELSTGRCVVCPIGVAGVCSC